MENIYQLSLRLRRAQCILAATDAEVIIGSLPPDDEPEAEIHRPHALPDNHTAEITVGDDTKSSSSDGSTSVEYSATPGELRTYITSLVPEDLTAVSSKMCVAKVRLAALADYADACGKIADEVINGSEHFIFNAPVNIISHLTGIFTTYVTRMFADFKRSELTEYIQSNRASVWAITDAPLSKIKDFELPLPVEINTTKLLDAYKAVEAFLVEADIRGRTDKLINWVKSVSRGSDVPIPATLDDGTLAIGEKAMQFLAKNPKSNATFTEIYGNNETFKQVIKTLADADGYLFAVSSTHANLKKADAAIRQVSKDVNAYQAKALSRLVKNFAEVVSTYGDCLAMVNILQHHVVIHLALLRDYLSE